MEFENKPTANGSIVNGEPDNGKAPSRTAKMGCVAGIYSRILFSKNEESEQASLAGRRADRPVARVRPQDSVHGQHALHQHDPAGERAALSGQSRDRATHQELRALERHGDGGQSQPPPSRYRRPHLDLRVVRDAVRSRVKSFLPRRRRRPAWRDMVYFQGHASPGVYSRAYIEWRINAPKLHHFRQELSPVGGLLLVSAPLS